jgi:hypothetical protein
VIISVLVLPCQAFDIPALFRGMHALQAASSSTWLFEVLFAPHVLALVAWRVMEGFVACALIVTLNPMPPCTGKDLDDLVDVSNRSPECIKTQSSLWQGTSGEGSQ